MLDITNADASANILRFADEGRLTQSQWHGRGNDGRKIACLLGAIDPSVTSAEECNGKLMPMWLAELTPTLFDGIPAAEIVPVARRYGELIARWGALAPEAWERVWIKFLIYTIDQALDAARPVSEGGPYWPAVEAACAQTKAALESGDRNGLKAGARDLAAAAAARAAWPTAAAEAARAARAARAAEAAAAAAAAWAAEAEAAAAAWAAEAAAAAAAAWPTAAAEAAAAAWAAEAAAAAAMYLRLFTFLLDQIEAECA
jgi:hypothetical protein